MHATLNSFNIWVISWPLRQERQLKSNLIAGSLPKT